MDQLPVATVGFVVKNSFAIFDDTVDVFQVLYVNVLVNLLFLSILSNVLLSMLGLCICTQMVHMF